MDEPGAAAAAVSGMPPPPPPPSETAKVRLAAAVACSAAGLAAATLLLLETKEWLDFFEDLLEQEAENGGSPRLPRIRSRSLLPLNKMCSRILLFRAGNKMIVPPCITLKTRIERAPLC